MTNEQDTNCKYVIIINVVLSNYSILSENKKEQSYITSQMPSLSSHIIVHLINKQSATFS